MIEHDLDEQAAVSMVRNLAEALDYCHRQKVMHRDLKPSNILIDDLRRPWLIDFGMARWMDHNSDFTEEKSIVGTPGYMPPEIMAGNSYKADARTDVYSLGIILFELLCKEVPAYPPAGVPLHLIDRV